MVIGAGAMPDVMLARAAGLEIGESRRRRASTPGCRPRSPGIYAAGDVAEYESVVHGGRRMRIEHWDVAFNQGKTAALNMLGRDRPHDVVPYFFSDLSDWASLEYVGPALRLGAGGRPRLDRRRRVHASSTCTTAASPGRCPSAAPTISSTRGGWLPVRHRRSATGPDALGDLSTDLASI